MGFDSPQQSEPAEVSGPVGELAGAVPPAALAVFAHPDDAELACGATLAKWAAAGSRVVVATVARGEKGSTVRLDPGELAALRSGEADRSGWVLGVAARVGLGRDDGEFENDVELRRDLVRLIRRERPSVVVTSDPTAMFYGSHVNHRDHRACGSAVLDAVAPAAAMPLYFPDDGDPHFVAELWLASSLQPDHLVDVSGWLDVKARALAAHRSQVVGGAELASAMLAGDPDGAGPLHADSAAGDVEPLVALGRLVEQRALAEGHGEVRLAEAFRRIVLSH